MAISLISSKLNVLVPRLRSQWIFLENHCHRSIASIFGSVLISLHTNLQYDDILDKFKMEGTMAKIKLTVAICSKPLHLLKPFSTLIVLFMDSF